MCVIVCITIIALELITVATIIRNTIWTMKRLNIHLHCIRIQFQDGLTGDDIELKIAPSKTSSVYLNMLWKIYFFVAGLSFTLYSKQVDVLLF